MSNQTRLFIHHDPPNLKRFQEPDPSIFTRGNVIQPVHTDPGADNWTLWTLNYIYTALPDAYRRDSALPLAPIAVQQQPAIQAYRSVIADVGANARLDCLGNWVPNPDAVDQRILADVRQNTGPTDAIKHPDVVGGYPRLAPGTPCLDRDHDGMPDAWEQSQGLDPDDPADSTYDGDGDGYTNLEAYLNG